MATWSEMWGIEDTPENRQEISTSLWNGLSRRMRRVIPCHPELLRTPWWAGLYLLQKMEVDLQPIPADWRQTIRDNAVQHRIQWLADPKKRVGSVYCYDGRAMYLGCCDYISLPAGAAERAPVDLVKDLDRQGLVRVEFASPDGDWGSVGLLPYRDRDGSVNWQNAGCGWCGISEARLALRQGWIVNVTDGISWSVADKYQRSPLRMLMHLLADLREQALVSRRKDLAAAYRNIGVQTIGELWSDGSKTVYAPGEGTLATYAGLDAEGRELHAKTVNRGKRPEWSHPEIAALVWAAARRRVTLALLEVPAETVLAVYGDAIYLSDPAPTSAGMRSAWHDSGKAGDLRFAWKWEGKPRRLKDWADLAEIKSSLLKGPRRPLAGSTVEAAPEASYAI